MSGGKRTTGFYIETLLMILVFVVVLLVLARSFAVSRAESERAGLLNNAVCLAENAAEAVSAAESPEELAALLDEGGNVRLEAGEILAGYERDMAPSSADPAPLLLRITWEMQRGGLVESVVTVWCETEAEPIYRLATASLTEEAGA